MDDDYYCQLIYLRLRRTHVSLISLGGYPRVREQEGRVEDGLDV